MIKLSFKITLSSQNFFFFFLYLCQGKKLA